MTILFGTVLGEATTLTLHVTWMTPGLACSAASRASSSASWSWLPADASIAKNFVWREGRSERALGLDVGA